VVQSFHEARGDAHRQPDRVQQGVRTLTHLGTRSSLRSPLSVRGHLPKTTPRRQSDGVLRDIEPDKRVEIDGGGGPEEAHRLILEAMARA
jgi:hypothetical protein